ncbi:hypothetical protein PAXRUDRAFT_825600 [Paxillus rubicundulus Ve08.2h10]|uniref:Uncharacterized protein n=1 Tax=Paxillus rubicundulus Ve08.2h10 TaxID=930991 RepID=A0A0D0DSY5_9AGAM|nr:hypothetical protein PAXRUDRAFT_825600 [Paxillus rubicundulus Ve08.2h10]
MPPPQAETLSPIVDFPTPDPLPQEFLQLPLPVALAGAQDSARRKKSKTARIDGFKVHWARLSV